MKNLNLLYFFVSLLCLVSFTSCSDDDDNDVSPNVSLLTAGVWTGSAVYVNGQDQTSTIEDANGIEWNKFTTVFERDGTYVESYDSDSIDEGVWIYENDERVIRFNSGTSNEYTVVISKLDEDEFFYIQNGLELRFTR